LKRRRATILVLLLSALIGPVDASPTSRLSPAEDNQAMFKRLFAGLGKSQSLPDLGKLQSVAVRSIVGDVTNLQDGEWDGRDWVYLAVNHEVLVEEGRRSSTQAKVLALKPGAALEELGFRLSMESKAHLLALRDAMADADGRTWTVVDLTVESDGRYAFQFSYEPPPRLGGNLLHSPLTGLLGRYLAARSE
jgi:hypothetical protein